MSFQNIIGGVAVKVRPDTSGFRREVKRDIDRELRGVDGDVNVKAKVEADTRRARADLKELRDEADRLNDTLHLRVRADTDDARRDLDEMSDNLRDLRKTYEDLKKSQAGAQSALNGSNKAHQQKILQYEEEARAARDAAEAERNALSKVVSARRAAQRAELAAVEREERASLKVRHDAEIAQLKATKSERLKGISEALKLELAQIKAAAAEEQDAWNTRVKNLERAKAATKSAYDTLAQYEKQVAGANETSRLRSAAAKASTGFDELERQVKTAEKSLRGWDSGLTGIFRRYNDLADEITKASKAAARAQDEGFQSTAEKYQQRVEDLTEARDKLLSSNPEFNAFLRGWKTLDPTVRKAAANMVQVRDNLRAANQEMKRSELKSFNESLRTMGELDLASMFDEMQRAQLEVINLKNRLLELDEDNNTSGLRKAYAARIKEVEGFLKRRDSIEEEYARRRQQRAYDELFNALDVDDMAKRYRKAMEGDLKSKYEVMKMEADVSISEESLLEARRKAKELKDQIDDLRAAIDVDLHDTFGVARQLDWITRPRTVNIIAKVNVRSLMLAEGMLQSLAGINVSKGLVRGLENVAKNFDTVSIKAASLMTIVGSIGSAMGSAVSGASALAGDLGKAAGWALVLPTAVATTASSIYVLKTAFSDFFTAMDRGTKWGEAAFEKLTPKAKELSSAWDSVADGMSDAIQSNFWENAAEGTKMFIEKALPEMRRGLEQYSTEMGKFFDGVGRSFSKLAISGDLQKMWDNLSVMMKNAAAGAEPLIDAFNRLGLRGSDLLPRMGTWIADIARDFDNWTKKADATGELTRRIEEAVDVVGKLASVSKSTVGIVTSLWEAANKAGSGGLDGLVDGLRRADDYMKSDSFQKPMVDIFSGANVGMSHLLEGVKSLGRSLGDSSKFLERILELSGQSGGLALTLMGRLAKNPFLQSGLLDSATSLRDMLHDLGPTVDNLGRFMGTAFSVAGTAAGNMVPILETITGGAADVADALKDGFEAIAPLVSGQFAGALSGVSGILVTMATAAGNLMEFIGGLPDPLGMMAVSVAALAISAPHVAGALGKMGGSLADKAMKGEAFRNMATNMQLVNAQGQALPGTFRRVMWGSFVQGAKDAGNALKGTATGIGQVVTAAGPSGSRLAGVARAAAPLKTAFSGLRAAGSGLLGVLGGPWGIAITAAIGVIGAFAAKQQEARQHVSNLTTALSEQGEAGLKAEVIEKYAGTLDKIRSMGINQRSITEALLGKGDVQQVIKDMERIQTLAENAADVKYNGGIDTGLSQADLDLLKKYNVEAESLSGAGNDWASITHAVKESSGAIREARDRVEQVNKALAETTGAGDKGMQKAADAMREFTSETADAETKTKALKRAMDAINGDPISLGDAKGAAFSALDALDDKLKSIGGQAEDGTQKMIRLKDVWDGADFNFESSSGRDLRDSLKEAIDAAQQYGAKIKESTGSTEDAVKAIEAQKQAWVENAAAMGIPAETARQMWEQLQGLSSEDFIAKVSINTTGKTPDQIAQELATINEMELRLGVSIDDKEAAARLIGLRGDFDAFAALAKDQLNIDVNTDEGKAKLGEITSTMREVLDANPQIIVGMDTRIFGDKAGEVDQKLLEWMGNNTQVVLGMDLSQFNNASDQVKAKLADIVTGDNANLDIALNMDLTKFEGQRAKVEQFILEAAKADPTILVGMDKTKFDSLSEDVIRKVMEIDGLDANVKAILQDLLSDKANSAKQRMEELDRTDANPSAKLNDGVTEKAKGAKSAIESVPRTWNSQVSATTSGLGNVRSLADAIRNVKGKTVTLMAHVAGAGAAMLFGANNADGSVMVKGGPKWARPTQFFGDGGFSMPILETPGRAKIYTATPQYRVFAEPETEGEAYIPLAASKRSRSLDIWRETGRRLGAFGDGGISGESGVTASSGPVFHINNRYPQAEPTSTTISKALQQSGNPSLFEG